jgi:serine phosphatase RsbU (regulator of sigma subunit)
MNAFATWDDQQQALMVQIRQEQLTRLARQYGVPVSQMNASGDMPDAVSQQIKRLEEQAQQAQQLRLQAEQAEKIKVKDTCRTKKIKLTTLQEERQNWSEVTNSLNDMMRDNYERERALTTQREQAQRRDDEIAELSRYLVKNCSP